MCRKIVEMEIRAGLKWRKNHSHSKIEPNQVDVIGDNMVIQVIASPRRRLAEFSLSRAVVWSWQNRCPRGAL